MFHVKELFCQCLHLVSGVPDIIAVLWTLYCWPYFLLDFSQFISLLWALKQEVLAVHRQQENIGMCLFKNVDTSYQEVMNSKVLNDCIHWNIRVWFILVVWVNELPKDLEAGTAAVNQKNCNLINGSLSQYGTTAFLPRKTGKRSISLVSTFVFRREG